MGGFWVMVDLGVLDELMEKVRTTVTILKKSLGSVITVGRGWL